MEQWATHRAVVAKRPHIINRKKERENMHTDRCGNMRRRKVAQKKAEKELSTRIYEYRYDER
jgi:hypothetical protein